MRRVARRVESGEVVRELAHGGSVEAIAWSPDGALLASGGIDNKVVVRRAESGEVLRELRHDESVVAIAWSPDGTLLASGGGDKKVVVRRGWGVRLAPAPSEANSSQVSTPSTLSLARMEAVMTPALAQATALLSAETAARQDAESGMARSRDELAQSRDELAQARDQLAQLRDQLAQARGEAQALRALPLEQLEALAGQLIEAR